MSDLLVVAYPEEHRAEEAMRTVLELRKSKAIDLEDVVSVSKDRNERIQLHQSEHLVRKGALIGGTAGLIAGILFAGPLVVVGVGALVGGVSGWLRDIGVPDDFVRQVSAQLRPESSALVLLLRSGDPLAVLSGLPQEGAVLLQTSLAPEAEAQLRAAFDAQSAEHVEEPAVYIPPTLHLQRFPGEGA
jgi:uncharacterized membrane protein